MAAQISINQLPPAGAITGAELVPVVQNGQTVQTTTGAISGSPSQTQSFLTVNQEPTLVNSRYLAVSTGLGLTNGGAGSFLRISLNGASGSLEAAGNGLVVKDSSSSVVARQIAVNGAGLSITDPSGVAGNPTLALSGLAAAFANLGGSGLAYVNAGTTAGLRLLTGTSNQITVTDGNGVAGNPTFALASNPVIPGTGAMTIPIGTSAQQPGGSDGQFRFNSDTGTFDGYAAGSWRTFSLSGGVTTFSAGSTGLTPAVPTSGSVTLAGTLNTSNGGTGLGGASPFTQYGILYASSANALTTGTALTFDGTNLGVGNNAFAWDTAAFNNAIDLSVYGAIYSTSSVAGVTGNVYYDGSAWHIKTLGPSTRYDQTAGSHVFYAAPTPVGLGNTTPTFVEILRLNTTGITLDGGTANGVLYLNGSKVATSGSQLTYNGLGVLTIARASGLGNTQITLTNNGAGASGFQFGQSAQSQQFFIYDAGAAKDRYIITSTGEHIWLDASEQMRLTSTGLGIGTSSPTQKLTVAGSVASNAGYFIPYNGATPTGYIGYGTALGTANDIAIRCDTGNILLGFSGSPAATLNSSGNLGLGVTPSGWGSGAKSLEGIGGALTFFDSTNDQLWLTQNAYWDGSWKYKTTNYATSFQQYLGSHVWFTAPSGTAGDPITFTQAMTLDASGRLVVNGTSPVASTVLTLQETSALSAALALKNRNSTQTWTLAVDATAVDDKILAFIDTTNAVYRMGIDSSGNLGLGVTPSAWGASYKAVQIPSGALAAYSTSVVSLYQNSYDSGVGAMKYVNSLQAAKYDINQGAHYWYIAPSGTAGNAITFTQAMTLDASGNLLVGTTTNVAGARLKSKVAAGTLGLEVTDESQSDFIVVPLSGAVCRVGPSAGAMAFYSANTERARITSGGDFFIGNGETAASPSAGILSATGGTGTNIAGANLTIRGGASTGTGAGGVIIFSTAAASGTSGTATNSASERARITSEGDLLVGTTSAGGGYANALSTFQTTGSTRGAQILINDAGDNQWVQWLWNKGTSGNNLFVEFGTEASYTGRGSITYNRAGGLVAYNTTSDYRAKDIIGPVTNSGEVIDSLKVYEGKMKGATQSRPMLIAHEAQAHAPYAVTGEKDAFNEDGTPKFQQIDVSSLVPLLLAEIQSLRQRVALIEGN